MLNDKKQFVYVRLFCRNFIYYHFLALCQTLLIGFSFSSQLHAIFYPHYFDSSQHAISLNWTESMNLSRPQLMRNEGQGSAFLFPLAALRKNFGHHMQFYVYFPLKLLLKRATWIDYTTFERWSNRVSIRSILTFEYLVNVVYDRTLRS